MTLFRQIVPNALHDNDLLEDVIEVPTDPLLDNRTISHTYQTNLQNKRTTMILKTIAPNDYSNNIKLLIAIKTDNNINNVHMLTHKKTPELDNYIEITHNRWIKQFDEKSLTNTKQ
jgi:Predicted NADH:ubiquinone oxidoreductase, subunit RnfG